ncbi:MAG: SDR family oxidoreductase [Bacteroidia bacterium]|nr:SDR family oxidoreductase [Bacteroidia bacterium]
MSKTAVVTGGNKGIGKEIARQLVERGYHTLILGRDELSGEESVKEISVQYPEGKIEYLKADLGSIKSTQKAIENIQGHFSSIDLLVNNAGVWNQKLKLNDDGLEMSFMVNHIAPLLLTHGLRPQLKEANSSRVVNVNSGLYIRGKFNLEETPTGKDFHGLNTYANSKLWNTMASIEMAERLKSDDISLNALHPGVINTGLGDMKGFMGGLLRLVKNFWGKPTDGAKSPVWVATAPELEGVTGKYYNIMDEWEYSPTAADPDLRNKAWESSLKLAGISWN